MSIIVLEKTKSDRIAKDVATIINALTKCYKDKPETLKKDNYSQIEITLPLNAEVETTVKVVDSILNRRGFAVSQLRIEENRSFIKVLIGITVKSHLALVAKISSSGPDVIIDDSKQGEPMLDFDLYPKEEPSNQASTDKQVGGNHYQLPIQPIEYILANGLGYCEANVVKYVSRWRNKGGIQDLKKAIHYLEMLIEQEEKDASTKS
jgi:hypothetical protein|nr:MAG TPA: nucelotide kinase [Caudoviricetes sp.]